MTGSSLVGQYLAYLPDATGLARYQGLTGIVLILFICFLFSDNRRSIKVRPVFWGVGLQVLIAFAVLNPAVRDFFFSTVDRGVHGLLGFAEAGIDFLFQAVVPHEATTVLPNGETETKVIAGQMTPVLKNVAFWVLPTVVFFAALISVLYHLGIMQWIVQGLSQLMRLALGTSGAETLSCTANIFVGQTEAPLLVKPFISKMTKSELMTVMTGGFATVAGGILAVYANLMRDVPGIAGHLVTASIMAAPAAIALSKIMVPETKLSATAGGAKIRTVKEDANLLEAVTRGASEGMSLALNIAAMFIAFVALLAMVNAVFSLFGTTFEHVLGVILSPLAWSMGIPWAEATAVGELLGMKLVMTEILGYIGLQKLSGAAVPTLSRRSTMISSYALCGFGNLISIGIQIGGIGAMAPERRGELAQLALRAMIAGFLVSCLSGTIIGLLV